MRSAAPILRRLIFHTLASIFSCPLPQTCGLLRQCSPMEKRAPSVYRLRIIGADSEIRQGLKFAGAGCEASLCNVAATSWGSEGAEIGAVALWGRAPSVYRNLKSPHGKAALTISGGGTGDGGRSDLFSVNESVEASTGGGLVFGALSRAAVLTNPQYHKPVPPPRPGGGFPCQPPRGLPR